MVDGFFAMPYELHMRFGRWDEMLAEPKPRDNLADHKRPCGTTAAEWPLPPRSDVDSAKTEQAGLPRRSKRNSPRKPSSAKTAAADLLGMAEKMLEGEILYRKVRPMRRLPLSAKPSAVKTHLHYMEPPDWIQPVRHALGAALMDAQRYAEAEAVYRDDLAHYPENGWSLYGLSQSLRRQGKNDEALHRRDAFRKGMAARRRQIVIVVLLPRRERVRRIARCRDQVERHSFETGIGAGVAPVRAPRGLRQKKVDP